MMQFNLLPDVKLEYLKARRKKRFVAFMSLAIGGATFAIFVLLFVSVNGLQRFHMSNLNRDIAADSQTLKDIPDLEKILTVQNQMNSLPDLHNKKPVASRLYGFLGQVTPTELTISDLEVDFEQNSMSVEGSADALSSVNKFIDSLKFTKFVASGQVANQSSPNAFVDVVLASFNVADAETTYQVDLNFNPLIFDSSEQVQLAVPSIISTRSAVQKPTLLFKEKQNEEVE